MILWWCGNVVVMVTRDPKASHHLPIQVIHEPPTQQHFIKDREGKVVSSLAVTLCPYLGSHQDPSTARSYVTPDNCCYHVQPATTVKGETQRTNCLTYNYTKCPIYRHQGEIKLPPKRLHRYSRTNYILPTIFVLLLIFTAVILASMTW